MATNTQIVAALEAHPAAPDQQCVPGNMTELAQRLAALLTVVSNTTEIDQQSTNSIAQQALETANIALATAQQATAAIPQTRSSGEPIALATGDSSMAISWSPAMPDTNYEVRGTYYGGSGYPTAFVSFHVEEGTRTVNGATLRFSNTPAVTPPIGPFKFAWVVQQLQ